MGARLASWVLFSALLGCFSGACSSRSGPESGTKTNWYLACQTDDDCDGLTCLCGVCSQACQTSAECGEEGVCRGGDNSAYALQCDDAVGSICLAGCAVASDCDRGRACVDGSCAAPLPDLGCPAEALVCSDFEDDALPQFAATAPLEGELDAVTESSVFGERSLLVSATGGETRTRVVGSFPARSTGTQYLKFWLSVAPESVLQDVHLLTLGDVDSPDWGVGFRFHEGNFAVGTPSGSFTSEIPVPVGQWFCVQQEVTLGDLDGAFELRIDGEVALSEEGVDTLPTAGTLDLSVGIDHKGQEDPVTVYIDGLALAEEPVPCVP